jgi:hypothetical protein
MDILEKQDTTTGNGISRTPILQSAAEPTAAKSVPPRKAASIGQSNTASETNGTKPQTLSETVSLLQTDFFDLKSFGCKVAILSQGGKIYLAIEHPDHEFDFDTVKGNILIDSIEAVK